MICLIIVLRTPEEVKTCLLFNKHCAPIVIDSQGRKTKVCITLEHDLPDFWTLEQLTCSALSSHVHFSNQPATSSIRSLAIEPHRRLRDVVFLKDLVSCLGSDSTLLQTVVSGQTREEDHIGDNFSHEHYCPFTSCAKLSNFATQMNLENWCVAFIPKRLCTVFLNAHVAWAMLKCVVSSPVFRWRLMQNFRRKFQRPAANLWGRCKSDLEVPVTYMLDIVSVWPVQHIGYAWGWYINHILAKRMLLEEAMAWLSTLGGAHSSLGEYFPYHAEQAGEISLKQLKIAIQMGDPLTVARCHMFWAFSLMQRGYWHKAKVIVRRVHKLATTHSVRDSRLINMCLSAWIRLQHLHRIHWQKKKAADCTLSPKKCRTAACGEQNRPRNSRISVTHSAAKISNGTL